MGLFLIFQLLLMGLFIYSHNFYTASLRILGRILQSLEYYSHLKDAHYSFPLTCLKKEVLSSFLGAKSEAYIQRSFADGYKSRQSHFLQCQDLLTSNITAPFWSSCSFWIIFKCRPIKYELLLSNSMMIRVWVTVADGFWCR